MDEKILAKLDEMNQKFDQKFDEMEHKFDELRNEMDEKFTNMKTELSSQIKKEVLDQMFVFETEYGRKINIMYEELTGKIQKDRNLQEDIAILEKRVDKNTAFVFSHENLMKAHERRIATLEKAQK